MICIAIALDKLDGCTGRKGLENCLWKIKRDINSFPSVGILFHITTGYWENLVTTWCKWVDAHIWSLHGPAKFAQTKTQVHNC